MDADDLCVYEPLGQAVIQPLVGSPGAALRWSADAKLRLARVPGMLREMVKKRAEAYVSAQGEDCVTCHHLSDLAAARFGPNGPPKWSLHRPGVASAREPEQA